MILITVVVVSIITGAFKLVPRAEVGSSQLGNSAHVILQGRFQYRTEPFDWRYWDDDTRGGSRAHMTWVRTSDSLGRLALSTES